MHLRRRGLYDGVFTRGTHYLLLPTITVREHRNIKLADRTQIIMSRPQRVLLSVHNSQDGGHAMKGRYGCASQGEDPGCDEEIMEFGYATMNWAR